MSNQVPVVLTNANQSFTDTQKAQGRTNIGAASTSDLSTEITNRTNADTTLQYIINNEATARNTADTTLSNRIGTLATNLSSEIRDREAADTAINATLANAVLYTAQSSTDTEKAQARTNIGAASTTDVSSKISSVTADGVVVDATTVDNAVTISGHQVTVMNTTNTAAPTFGGTLDLYHLNGNDEYGRITGVEKLTITMPSSTATTSAAGLMSASDKSKLTNTYYAVYPGDSKSLTVGTNYISGYTNFYKGAHLTIFQGTTYDTTFTQGDKITLNILDVTSGTTINATQDFIVPQTGVPFSCVILCYSYNTVASGEHMNFKLTKTSSTSTGTTTFVNATIQDWCINAG